MSRQPRRSSPRQEANRSPSCAKNKNKQPLSPPVGNCPSAPLTDIVIKKEHLAKLALHNTSCAGCMASVRALLGRPLSELRMLKAVVDEHGSSALRLKDAYVNNPKRMEQLLDTFPMSSVLKKVQPVGSAQRCQLHRRLYSLAGGSSGGSHRGGDGAGGGAGSGGGRGGGVGPADLWDWEDAWERMPPNLRCKVATVKSSTLEAAMHHATDANRFCSDCKHNVVQAHDILMGKIELEGSENEEEFDEEMFLPFEDRVFEGESGNLDDKVLVCDVMDVEDLIYFHEDFSSQDFDSSCSGQQRHAATLEHGQREVRSILGALLLTQLRSVWHAQTAQVQGEQYLFCLVVDAVRTALASHGAAPHGDDLMAIDAEERCAAEERRQKRRHKRKERKRAGRAQINASANAGVSAGAGGGNHGGGNGGGGTLGSSNTTTALRGGGSAVPMETHANNKAKSAAVGAAGASASAGLGGSAVLARRIVNGRAVVATASGAAVTSSPQQSRNKTSPAASARASSGLVKARGTPNGAASARASSAGLVGARGMAGGDGGGNTLSAAGEVGVNSSVREAGKSRAPVASGLNSGIATKAAASHGGFGAGGLAFQLRCGDEEDSDGDYVDHDLISEMEELKTSLRSKSDIDFLRKTLRQNYDRFISQEDGRVR